MTNFTKDDFAGMEGKIIYTWTPLFGDEVFVINTWTYVGRRLFDLRAWHPKSDGKLHAGKGIRVRREELRDLFRGIRLLQDYVDRGK